MEAPAIALVQPPWGALERPSIQLGLLQAQLAREGVPARQAYLNLDLARQLGPALYRLAGDRLAFGIGEWMFGRTLWDLPDALAEVLAHREAHAPLAPAEVQGMTRAAEEGVPLFVRGAPLAIRRRLGRDPQVVGITATMDQLLPALAIARAVKERWPACRVVLGGSQVSGPAADAVARAFDWIDCVVDGEADEVAAGVFRALLDGDPGLGRVVRGSPPADLDGLPTPLYGDWLAEHPQALTPRLKLCVELSRGCWYEDLHGACTFCGLCQHGYRAKSSERIGAELRELSAATWLADFLTTDTLVPMTALAALEALDLDLRLFAEVRPRMSLRQVARAASAGIRQVQPGIESFDSELLGMMAKGTEAIDNVGFLAACARTGVHAVYNLLFGLPGEPAAAFDRMAALVPRLHHLQPPHYLVRLHLDRYSPFFEHAAEFGITEVRPARRIASLFPPGAVDLGAVAAIFEGTWASAAGDPAVDRLHRALLAWCRAREHGARLTVRRTGGGLHVADSREPGRPRAMMLQGDTATALLACPEPVRLDLLARKSGLGERVEAATRQLVDLELALVEGDRVLGLPIPFDAPGPGPMAHPTLRVEDGLPMAVTPEPPERTPR